MPDNRIKVTACFRLCRSIPSFYGSPFRKIQNAIVS
jgi:hypothetical protein